MCLRVPRSMGVVFAYLTVSSVLLKYEPNIFKNLYS